MTANRLHAVLMTAYSWHAVLMTAFDSISHACSSIKSIQSTQSEQLTRTSQCLFIEGFPNSCEYCLGYYSVALTADTVALFSLPTKFLAHDLIN